MLAIDTNLIVRYLTADHLEQSLKAKALIDSEDVFVTRRVGPRGHGAAFVRVAGLSRVDRAFAHPTESRHHLY
jgi:predicted nucleic acid-binding protein